METKDDDLIMKILKKVNKICPNTSNNISIIKLLGFLMGIVLMIVCADLELERFMRKILFLILISVTCGVIKIVKKADEISNEPEGFTEIELIEEE